MATTNSTWGTFDPKLDYSKYLVTSSPLFAKKDATKTEPTPAPVTPEQFSNVNSSTLSPNPDFHLTQPNPTTQASSLNGYIESLSSQTQDAKKATEASQKSYTDLAGSILGEVALTDAAYSAKGGVDQIKTELDDIQSQIMAEQHALTRTLEAIDKNKTGMFGGALEAAKDKATRESVAKQADLAIVQMSIQGRYDTAKAIADRAVAVAVEKNRAMLDAAKLNYENNANLFSESEKRLFQLQYDQYKAQTDKIESDSKTIKDLAIAAVKNGAPASVATSILRSGSFDQALGLASGYVGDSTSTKELYTQTQLNRGAAHAAVSLDNFKTLDSEVQNFYINSGPLVDAFNEAVASVRDGTETADTVTHNIDTMNIPQSVKDHLKQKLAGVTPKTEEPGILSTLSKAWDGIKSFFGN